MRSDKCGGADTSLGIRVIEIQPLSHVQLGYLSPSLGLQEMHARLWSSVFVLEQRHDSSS